MVKEDRATRAATAGAVTAHTAIAVALHRAGVIADAAAVERFLDFAGEEADHVAVAFGSRTLEHLVASHIAAALRNHHGIEPGQKPS